MAKNKIVEKMKNMTKNKIVKTLVLFSIVLSGAAATACNKVNPTPTPEPAPVDPVDPIDPVDPVDPDQDTQKQVVKVATPVLTKNGTVYSFERDENASRYFVKYGDQEWVIEGNTFNMGGLSLSIDKFSIYATAKADTEEIDYQDSDKTTVEISLTDFLTEDQIDELGIENIEKVQVTTGPQNARVVVSGTYLHTSSNTLRSRVAYMDMMPIENYSELIENYGTWPLVKFSGKSITPEAAKAYLPLVLERYQQGLSNEIKTFLNNAEYEIVGDVVGNYSSSAGSGNANLKMCATLKNNEGELAHVYVRQTINIPYANFVDDYVSTGVLEGTESLKFYEGDLVYCDSIIDVLAGHEEESTASAASENIIKSDTNSIQYYEYEYTDGTKLNEGNKPAPAKELSLNP